MNSFSVTELESEESKKLKCDNSLSGNEDVSSQLTTTTANKLCEDELSLIFSNLCISTKDLLNFRCVNKSWRDAATTTLLQRDACYMTLDLVTTPGHRNGASESTEFFCKHGNTKATLTELTAIISDSPKFPISNLHIHFSWVYIKYYPDLKLFFELHGDKIKTLCPHDSVSLKYLTDILFKYAPKLECLNLDKAELLSSAKEDLEHVTSKLASKVLPLKSLILGNSFDKNSASNREFMHLLVSSPSSKLCYIENVNLFTLPHIIKAGKIHLVRSFKYATSDSDSDSDTETSVTLMNQFSEKYPKLSNLMLNIQNSNVFSATLTAISAIIESSKEIMTNFEISMNLYDYHNKLKIPPMRSLQSIILSGTFGDLDAPLPIEGVGPENKDIFLLELEDEVARDKYFPRLRKVTLKSQNLDDEENPMVFLFRRLLKSGSTKRIICFPKVEILRMHECILPEMSNSNLISDCFPNIRVFKFCWYFGRADYFNSSLWALCPQVQLLDIYDISILEGEKNESMTSIVDAYFTGFPLGICAKLLSKDCSISEQIDNPEMLDFLRTGPSVCDLRHLTELKLTFLEKPLTQFVSHVTGAYAFSKMPNTKFIISYDPKEFAFDVQNQNEAEGGLDKDKDTVDDDPESSFASIKPYVQIIQETQTR